MKIINSPFSSRIFAIFLAFGFVSLLNAQTPGKYYIKAQLNNKALDVQWANNANGTLLHTWDFSGGDAQQFTLEQSNEAGYFYIKTYWGRALDAASPNSEAILHTWNFHGGDNQKWKFIPVGNGYFNIQCKQGGNYIDIKKGVVEAGAYIWMAAYSTWGGNIAQRWKLEAIGATGASSPISRTRVERRINETSKSESITSGRFCTSQRVSYQNGDFEALVTRGIKENIYPGAFYNLNSVVDGTFQNYNVPRSNMELTIDLVGAASRGYRDSVKIPINKGQVMESVSRLLSKNTTRNAAEISYFKEHIESEEQLAIAAQAKFNGWGADVQANFGYNTSEKKGYYLVRFVQRYFTVDVNHSNALTLISSRTTPIQGDPVYISSVSYGRIGMLKIESDESEEKIMAALNGSYTNGVQTGSGSFKVEYARTLQNARFTVFIYGGNAEVGVRAIGGIQEFDAFVRAGANYDRNVAISPISYKMRFLKDSREAYINTVLDYVEQSCTSATYFKVNLSGISISHPEGVWGYVDFEVWELDENGNRSRQVFPARAEGATRLWEKTAPNRMPCGGHTNNPIGNINKEWEFYVNPAKMSNNQVLLVGKCRLEAEHKDNDISSVGWHGMRAEESREVRLNDLLNNNGNQIVGGKLFKLGEFISNTDRQHGYIAQFIVSGGR
jgi:Thiol-activated cytolysin/Ricin-type beta-trefoil lectin domain-like